MNKVMDSFSHGYYHDQPVPDRPTGRIDEVDSDSDTPPLPPTAGQEAPDLSSYYPHTRSIADQNRQAATQDGSIGGFGGSDDVYHRSAGAYGRPIGRSQRPAAVEIPAKIQAMRSLEIQGGKWFKGFRTPEHIFYQEALLMADYEDDYLYPLPVFHQRPSYKSLSSPELRGYFGWRSRWRKGEKQAESTTFAQLYASELINLVGVGGVEEGYARLRELVDDYRALDPSAFFDANQLLKDFRLQYRSEGERENLGDDRPGPDEVWDGELFLVRDPDRHEDGELFSALAGLAAKDERALLDGVACEDEGLVQAVVARVWRGMADHYRRRRKSSLFDDYFGPRTVEPYFPFRRYFFYARKDGRTFDVDWDPLRLYHFHQGSWTVTSYPATRKKRGKIANLLTGLLDLLAPGDPSPSSSSLPRWISSLALEEKKAILEERRRAQARRITIDFSRLDAIRQDSALTRDKLIVDEEEDAEGGEDAEDRQHELLTPDEVETFEEAVDSGGGKDEWGLTEEEDRYLRCLLAGEDLSWLSQEGLMESILVDSINDHLFEFFSDTVIEPDPQARIVDDYRRDLAEHYGLDG